MMDSFDDRSVNVRYDNESRQALEKANFDMKMKLYHLEEELRRLKKNGNGHSMDDMDELRSNAEDLRLQLQERGLELDQRNALLSKAKKAIEALKMRIEELQFQDQKNRDIERKFENLQQSQELVESSFKLQIQELSEQLQRAREHFHTKEHERNVAEEKVGTLERSALIHDKRNYELTQQNAELSSKLSALEQKHSKLMEEVVQKEAHCDLFRLQSEELNSECNTLRNMCTELKHKNTELMITSEGNVKEQRNHMQLDIEKLKQQHLSTVSDLKEQHMNNQVKLRAEIELAMKTAKDFECDSYARTIKELEQRLQMKEEEVRSVKHLLDNDGIHAQHLTAETIRLREELSEYKGSVEAFRLEGMAHKDEVVGFHHQIDALQKEYHSLVKLDQENKQTIKTLTNDLTTSKDAQKQLASSLETAQTLLKELESTSLLREHESRRIHGENGEYKQELQDMRTVVRENERLKLSQVQLQSDVKDIQHSKTLVDQQLSSSTFKIQQLEDKVAELSGVVRDKDDLGSTMRQSREHMEAVNTELSFKNAQLEAVVSEQRVLSTKLQEDLRTERSAREGMESVHGAGRKETLNELIQLRKSCESTYNGMVAWEETLSTVLEPVLFGHGHSTGASASLTVAQFNPNQADVGSLCQNISTQISVVNKVIARIVRIRELFASNIANIQSQAQAKVDISMDRVMVTNQKLSLVEQKQESLRGIFDRDRKIRHEETQDMKQLKEHVLLECGDKIRDAEMKYLTLKSQHDQELFAFQQTHSANEIMKQEIVEFKASVKEFESKVTYFTAMEVEFNQCKLNLDHLKENNRLISYEMEERGQLHQRACKELERVERERDDVAVAAHRLTDQVTKRDVIIAKYESDLGALTEENKVLKSKQMDPKLVAMIKQSQSLVHSTGNALNASTTSSVANTGLHTSSMHVDTGNSQPAIHHIEQPRQELHQAHEVPSTPVLSAIQKAAAGIREYQLTHDYSNSAAADNHREGMNPADISTATDRSFDVPTPTHVLNKPSVAVNSALRYSDLNSTSSSQFGPTSVSAHVSSHRIPSSPVLPLPRTHMHAPLFPPESTQSMASTPYSHPPRELNFNYKSTTPYTQHRASSLSSGYTSGIGMNTANANDNSPRTRLEHLASNMNSLTQKLDSYGIHNNQQQQSNSHAASVVRNTPGPFNTVQMTPAHFTTKDSRDFRSNSVTSDHYSLNDGHTQSAASPSHSQYSSRSRSGSITGAGVNNPSSNVPLVAQSPYLHFNYSQVGTNSSLNSSSGATRYTKL